MRLRLMAGALVAVAGLAHAQETVTAFVSHNYIGCRHPQEINRVFADFGTVSKSAHGAALHMRRCVFLSQGDLVSIIGDAPPSLVEDREQAGYYVAKRSGSTVWFPRALLTNFATHTTPEPAPEPKLKPNLAGPLPIGRWSVWMLFDPERHRESNNGWPWDIYRYSVEFTGDGLGCTLLFYGLDKRMHGGFRFPAMGDNVWTRDDELSWTWTKRQNDHDLMVLSTTYETIYTVSTATEDFISMTETMRGGENTLWPHGERLILARLGSDEYWDLVRFYNCVKGNDGKPIHKLDTCETPFVPDERPKGPPLGRVH